MGIIGAGHIGGALARRFAALGHDVAIANSRGPETLAELAAQTGAHAVRVTEAARGAGAVVVTIPERAVGLLPSGVLQDAVPGAAIVDTCNYYPRRDGRIAAIEAGMAESRWVAQQLGRTVVKAFNNIQAQRLLDGGRPAGSPDRIALPVAGDDLEAKSTVMQLVDALGFDAVDAGGLDDSWRQQPGTPVYGVASDAEGVRRALAAASPLRGPAWRA